MSNTDPKAVVRDAGNDFFIATTPGGYTQVIDSNGERRSAPTPVELLLISVAGCTAIDVVSILKKKRQQVTDYKVEISGTRRTEYPKGYTGFHVHHIVYGRSVSEKAVADAIELSDKKYCSVAYTVRPTAEITTSFEINEDSAQ